MKTFIAIAFAACAIPSVMCFFDLGTTAGLSFPFFTIGGTTTTGAASTGLAITGLASGTALAAGLGGVVAAIGAGALAGGALAAITRGSRGGSNVRGRGGRRGKRSIVDDEIIGEEFIFEAINKMDDKDCGKRYVCELAATPVDQLSQSELTSLLLFQTRSPVAGSGKAKFDEAIRFGVTYRTPLACQRRYATCPNQEQ